MVTIRSSPGCLQFVNLASGSNLPVATDSELCTTEVQLSDEFTLDGKTVILIDTPGFNNTSTTDTEILKKIRPFLKTTKCILASVVFQSSGLNFLTDMEKISSFPGSFTSTESPIVGLLDPPDGISGCSVISAAKRH